MKKKAAGTAPDDVVGSWSVEMKEPRVDSQSSEEMRRTRKKADKDIAMALEGENVGGKERERPLL